MKVCAVSVLDEVIASLPGSGKPKNGSCTLMAYACAAQVIGSGQGVCNVESKGSISVFVMRCQP